MPTNTTVGVSQAARRRRTAVSSSAGMNPLRSATPMPSIPTITMPSGGKLMKLGTNSLMAHHRPSPSSRLRAVTTVLSASALRAGFSICQAKRCARSDTKNNSPVASANSVAGWGRALPQRSILSSSRGMAVRS